MGTIEAGMLADSNSNDRNHVLIFPFMAKGHTIPLLHLAASLAGRRVDVTLLTTPGNSSFLEEYLLLPRPNIHIATIPFPEQIASLPPGCESTDALPSFDYHPAFVIATKLLEGPFRAYLQDLSDAGNLPLCVISDFFCWWTGPACTDFGVPRLMFHGMGVFSMFLCKNFFVHQPHRAGVGAEGIHIPGTPDTLRLTASDVPHEIRNPETAPLMSCLMEAGLEEMRSWGVLVNSFAELESEYVASLETFYGPGTHAWLVGPMSQYPAVPGQSSNGEGGGIVSRSIGDDPCLRWLERKAEGSVLYVSFGTQASVSDEQLDEISYGLEMSGYDFILVVRSDTWKLPGDLAERLKETRLGLVHRGWAPQREVLAHPSTGGFLSHCGWNSFLEAVCAGVPILSWPMIGEQPLNARFLVDVVKVALRVEGSGGETLVGRAAVCKGVSELMGGEKGKQVREEVAQLGKVARGAVKEDGSSVKTLDRLLQELRAAAKETLMDGVLLH